MCTPSIFCAENDAFLPSFAQNNPLQMIHAPLRSEQQYACNLKTIVFRNESKELYNAKFIRMVILSIGPYARASDTMPKFVFTHILHLSEREICMYCPLNFVSNLAKFVKIQSSNNQNATSVQVAELDLVWGEATNPNENSTFFFKVRYALHQVHFNLKNEVFLPTICSLGFQQKAVIFGYVLLKC